MNGKHISISDVTDRLTTFLSEGGSPNPELNPRLHYAIEEAKRRDVPRATIQGFLKKLSETKDKSTFQRHLFEGRLYKKLYFIATVFTDTLPHARIQMATPYKKHLAENINAKRVFIERGVFDVITRDNINMDKFEDECLNDAIECEAEDVEVFDAAQRKVTFFCDARDFLKVRHKLSLAGHQIERSELVFIPNTNLVRLSDTEMADYKKFKTRLDDIVGFDDIFDNLENDDDDDDVDS